MYSVVIPTDKKKYTIMLVECVMDFSDSVNNEREWER
jgi:hypothetical protein